MSTAEDNVVIRNIYYMMAYAFHAVDVREYARLGSEDFDCIEDLMAAILSIGMDVQRKRGLERAYVGVEESLFGVRGSIDMRETVRLRMANRRQVACRYDEFLEDTYKNRILKTVAQALVGSDLVGEERKRDLKRSLLHMRDVGTVDPKRIEWKRLRYHRNNGGYQLLMNVCWMVVHSMLMTQDDGGMRVAEFSDDQQLYRLYEKFVLEYFIKHHPDLHPSAKAIPLGVEGDAPSFLPQLFTDVTLEHGDRMLIIDCKCYGRILKLHYGNEVLSANNSHQISNYVATAAYNRPDVQVSGMLLYAMTEGEQVQETSWSRIGHDFYLRTLDLGQDFEGIARQLDDIAELVKQV